MPVVKLVDRSSSLRFQFPNGLAGAVPGSRPIFWDRPGRWVTTRGLRRRHAWTPGSLPPRRLTSNDEAYYYPDTDYGRLGSVDRSGTSDSQSSGNLAGAKNLKKPLAATSRSAAPRPPTLARRKDVTSKEPGSKRLPSRTGLPRPLHTQQVIETIKRGSPTPHHTKRGNQRPRGVLAGPPV